MAAQLWRGYIGYWHKLCRSEIQAGMWTQRPGQQALLTLPEPPRLQPDLGRAESAHCGSCSQRAAARFRLTGLACGQFSLSVLMT